MTELYNLFFTAWEYIYTVFHMYKMCVLIYVCIRFAGATYRHVVCQVTCISSIAVPQLWIHSNGLGPLSSFSSPSDV